MFTFSPSLVSSIEGEGLMVMSIDNLPTEMAAEASHYFGDSLSSLIPKMASLVFDLQIPSSFTLLSLFSPD